MATAHACAALVDAIPGVVRLKRTLVVRSSSPDAAALGAVAELGHPRVSEVAAHLHLDMSTVSRQIAQLRQRDLVAACPDPADGRSQQLTLTPAGRDELLRRRRALIGDLAQRLAAWDDADVEQLAHLLERLGGSGGPEPPPPSCAPLAHAATTAAAQPQPEPQENA